MSKRLSLKQVGMATAVVVSGYDKMSTFGVMFRMRPHRLNKKVTRLLIQLPVGCNPWLLDYKDKKRILEILKIDEDMNKVIWMTPAYFLPQDTKRGWITCRYSGNGFFYFAKGGNAVIHERKADLTDEVVRLNNGKMAEPLRMRDYRGNEPVIDGIKAGIMLVVIIVLLVWLFTGVL